MLGNTMIKPLILILAWLAGGVITVVAFFLVCAPYFTSVVANIGRRPAMPAQPWRPAAR
jgi:hypothetical protein